MAQTTTVSFPTGAIDKGFRNVKTNKGWQSLRLHLAQVNPKLKINERHRERLRQLKKQVSSV